MQLSKYGLPTLKMDERRDELRGFTIDRIKELCSAKHIKVYGKTKDALIEQLLEVESTCEGGESTADAEEKLSTTHLMDMVWRMQQDQRAWLEAQQRMQEEMLLKNQKTQQEMLDAVLSASRAREASSPVATERRVKPPKTYLAETL